MTPERVVDLQGLTKNVSFEIRLGAELRSIEPDLPSAEELDRWFATPVARAA